MNIDLVLKRLELIKEGKGIGTISDIEASIILNKIERLNNIINKLEKWCKEQAKDFRENNKPFCYEYESIADEYENILEKLQELKGDGSNE